MALLGTIHISNHLEKWLPSDSVGFCVDTVQSKPIVLVRDAFQCAFTQTCSPTLPTLSLNVAAPAKQEVASLKGATHNKVDASAQSVSQHQRFPAWSAPSEQRTQTNPSQAETEGPSHIIQELCTKIHNEQTDRNYYVEDHSDALGNMTSPPLRGAKIRTIMASIVNTERLEARHYTTKPGDFYLAHMQAWVNLYCVIKACQTGSMTACLYSSLFGLIFKYPFITIVQAKFPALFIHGVARERLRWI